MKLYKEQKISYYERTPINADGSFDETNKTVGEKFEDGKPVFVADDGKTTRAFQDLSTLLERTK